MRTELRPQDIEVFSNAITDFFTTYTNETACVRSAYLIEPDQPAPWNDFTGVIEVSGAYRGRIAFSAPRALLSHVLLKMGESDFTDERHGDIVGEIANTLSGQARRHFGEGLQIAPPRLADPANDRLPDDGERPPYAIPLRWHGYEASLIVHLEPRGRT